MIPQIMHCPSWKRPGACSRSISISLSGGLSKRVVMAAARIQQTTNKQMQLSPDGAVVRAFSRAVNSYDANAVVQMQAVEFCCDRLSSVIDSVPSGDVLEIGCGTGMLSERLAQMRPVSAITFTDPAEAMLQICEKRLLTLNRQRHAGASLAFECVAAEDLVMSAR